MDATRASKPGNALGNEQTLQKSRVPTHGIVAVLDLRELCRRHKRYSYSCVVSSKVLHYTSKPGNALGNEQTLQKSRVPTHGIVAVSRCLHVGAHVGTVLMCESCVYMWRR